jgi:hypothetical protein
MVTDRRFYGHYTETDVLVNGQTVITRQVADTGLPGMEVVVRIRTTDVRQVLE